MALLWLIIILHFVVSYFVSMEFQYIARLKGYSDKKYFWYPFLLSIIGYLMVIALPVRSTESSYENGKQAEEASHEEKDEIEQEDLPEL